jgi:hypothetical protein
VEAKTVAKRKNTAKGAAMKKALPRPGATHEVRIKALESAVKTLKAARGSKTFALTADAGATTAVTFEWSPSGAASWVKVDGQQLTSNPSTLQLTPGNHVLEYMFTGAPKTPWRIVVTGAKFPTAPITGAIPDEGFVAGYCYVLV